MEFKRLRKHSEKRPVIGVSSRHKPTKRPSTSPPPVITSNPTPPRSRTYPLLQLKLTEKGLTSLIIIGFIGFILASSAIHQYLSSQPHSTSSQHSNEPSQKVLPRGKSIDELGGWKRVSPEDSDPVFAYTDTLDKITISVSQQPLPDSFKGDVDDQVFEVAKKFNATKKINANDTIVYIGASAKGPQSVIFTKNNVLILIKSQKEIPDKTWSTYITSLQ